MSSEVVAPQTGAANVDILVDAEGQHVTVAASGLAGETISIDYNAGGTFIPSGYVISAAEAAQVIVGAGMWRLTKGTTAAPVGIYVSGSAPSRIWVT